MKLVFNIEFKEIPTYVGMKNEIFAFAEMTKVNTQ